MNTQSIPISKTTLKAQSRSRELVSEHLLRQCTRWTVAVTVALSVVVAGIWAATTPALHQYLSALLWGTGLLFFAIAIEVKISRVMPVVFTGLALPVLAVLGSRVAEEFLVIAVTMVAVWLAVWIGRRK